MSPSRAAESFRKGLEEGLTGLGPWARSSKKEEVHLQGFKKLPAGISLGVGQEVLPLPIFSSNLECTSACSRAILYRRNVLKMIHANQPNMHGRVTPTIRSGFIFPHNFELARYGHGHQL